MFSGNSLLSHKQWKHADGSRPYPCQVCAKSFPTKGAVKKHESIHKTERTHPCQLCDKKFARADHLKSHMRSHQNSTANSIVWVKGVSWGLVRLVILLILFLLDFSFINLLVIYYCSIISTVYWGSIKHI